MRILTLALAAQSLAWAQGTPEEQLQRLQQELDLARQKVGQEQIQAAQSAAQATQLEALDTARRLQEEMRVREINSDWQRRSNDLAAAMAQLAAQPPTPPTPPKPPGWAPLPPGMSKSQLTDEERAYRSGKSALEDREWERAASLFEKLADRKGSRADASLYWKAYAQNKLGRRNEALATLEALSRSYANSRWLDDARALEVEVKQSAGQPVSPESEADEDLKILAVNGMIHTDPENAIPVLERLLSRSNSPRLKERALFVLAQSKSPKAREVLVALAKGKSNPDIQYKAVEYLGYHNAPETRQALTEIYTSNSDPLVKKAVIRGYAAGRMREPLVAAARSEQNAELRREAIRGLGSMGADAELWTLYQSSTAPEARIEILRALPGRKDNLDKLIEYAKSEKDPAVRRELVQQIGIIRSPKSSETLIAMYGAETDTKVKRSRGRTPGARRGRPFPRRPCARRWRWSTRSSPGRWR
jgi:TolA-binding protein